MRITKSLGKSILLCFFLFLFTSSFKLKTEEGPDAPISNTLTHGDIAFIGVNEDPGPTSGRDHSFTWVALKDIPAGEVIYFTEEGWRTRNTDTGVDANFTPSGYWVGTSEGHFKWTAPAGGLPKGSIVHIYETGTDVMNVIGGGTVSGILAGTGWNLSTGDQVIAYQTSTGARPAGVVPTFLAAIHLDDGLSPSLGYDATTGWSGLTENGGSAYSNVPPGLTNGFNCISLFNPNDSRDYENDNVRYKGVTTGTKSQLMRAINSDYALGAGNWEGNNSAAYDITSSGYSAFTVSPNSSSSTGSLAGATVEFVELTSTKTINNSDDNLLGTAADYSVEFQIGSIKNLYVDIDESTLTLAGRNSSTINANVINFNFSGGTFGTITGATINTLESSVNTTGLSISHTANSVTITGLLNFDFSNNVTIGAVVFNIVTSGASSNTAPTIGGASAGQTVNDNATISPFSGITIADADGDNLTATITLDNNAKGIITGASSGSGPYTITSRTPAAMQTALRALVFNPTDNRTATSETTTFTIVVNDGTDTDTDNTTTVIASAVAPTVTSVSSSTGNGTYKVGDAIAVTVTFSESVTVTGSLQLTLETGSVDRVINYTSGTGSSTLTFSYTVQAGDNNADLDYVATNSLGLNGGTIKDAGGKDAILTLAIPGAANSLGANKALVIDGIVPTVTSVSSTTANGTYKVGDAVAITVTFSEAVTVTGTPQITLETGTTDRTVNYSSGSGSNTLIFNYTVQSGDVSADLDYVATNSLALNGGTIKDGAGNDATLTLATPGAANSLGANKALVIDGIAPTVTSVSSSTNNGTYKVGDAVAVTVTFSESVTVTGTPQITLETGTTDRAADYTSGSGSNTLTFNYTVQSGDVSADLDYVATTSLALNSGTIKDASGNNATLTLATPGAANSLGANKALVIDAVAPVITSLSLHNGNTFVEIFASEGLYSTNGGSGALEISDISISISGGTATNPVITSLKKVDGTTDLTGGENIIRVTFTTTGLADGSEVVKIDFADGSSVFDAAGNAASATQSNNTRILNDLIKPNITGVSLAADNSYIDVTFNEGVYEDNCAGGGLQASDFNLSINNGTATTPVISSVKKNDNTVEGSATAPSGGETVVRIFFSVTGTPDGAETLEVDLQANAVFDQNGLTADANQTTNNTASLNDKTTPTVLEVTSNATNGTFKVGDNINIYVQYSEEVLVTGTPQLELETGTTDRTINYVDRSVSTLRFVYTVQAGDVSADLDVTSSAALSLNGGTIKDAAGNNASLTVQQGATGGSLALNKAIVIDGVVPTVTSVSSTTNNGTYNAGDAVAVTVTFSEAVTVTGTPQITLETGTTDRTVNYTSGSGSNTLTFNYTIQAGDVSADLDYVATNSLTLNSGTIKDASGNDATLTLATPGAANSLGANKAIVVDAVSPTVTSVSVPANGSNPVNSLMTFTVNTSENVIVNTTSGTPQIAITIGSNTRQAVFHSNSGTQTLVFRYRVVAGDEDTDGITVGALDLNGGTMKDAAGNDLVTTLNSVGATTAVLVDGIVPTVTSVSSTKADGAYKVGEVIGITLTFSEAVDMNLGCGGAPYITLETGGTDRDVDYSSGSGTNTLTFNYTVQAGDTNSDLDYVTTTSLVSNGSIIADAAGNDAVLTLPVPGAANSLGANKAIVIDGIAPAITSVSSTKADGSYGLGEVIAVTVTFDEAVTVTGIPQLELETGAVDRKVDYSIGTGTNTLTFNYTVQMGDESADLDYKATNALTLNGGTIKDAAGNDATLTLAAPAAANSLGNNKALVVEAFPTVTLSVGSASIAEASGTSTVTATLSAISSQDVTVNLAYSGTATSGIDYNNTASTSITVPAGSLSANAAVGITATQDVNPETNETIIIDITGVTKGTENGTQQQTITITDDDTPNVSFTSTTSSGLESVSSANITVDLNIASALTVTVNYTVTGTASSGTDYTLANGTLTFNPADVQETITIAGIVDDAILEPNETVIITLSNPGNANLGTNTAHTYTITDNDAAAVTIADVSGNENGGAITLTATLDNAVQGGFTVEVSTADGTATTADSDYTAITSQTLTFAGTAGETQTFTITPTGDTKLEGNETVTISQGNLAATSLSVNITDQATVTINNDDNASVTIADVSGSENGGAITLTATLDNAVQGGFTVDVNTTDGTALAASDYTAVTSQTLTFAGTAGETQTFTVTPTDDAVEESTETLTVSMNNLAATALGVTITDNATITLTDDDDNTAPSGFTITISDALISASETATTKFTFAGAEVGTTYNYTVSSNNGGINVTGTGTIVTATDQITINNLSGLNDGTLSLSVTLTDGSSNTSTAQTATSQLDKTAPAAPVVTTIDEDTGSSATDELTNDQTLSFNGTAEANATVEVFIGASSIGTTTANGSGDWTFDHTATTLAEGSYAVTAKATDAAGNTSAASTAVNVTIDATAPAAPVITSITPDSGTSTTDKITNDQTNLTITGTGEANSQLEITVNGITYSGLPVDGSGNWSIAVGAILGTDGTYPVTATVTDAAGNQSAASAAFSIIYDTTAPAAPTVDLNAASDLGQSNTDNITHYNATDGLMLSGTAEANAAIELSLTYNGTTFSGLTAAADGSGNWSYDAGAIISGILADGTVNNLVINAQATDAAGNQGAAGTLTVVLDQQMTATLSPADNAIDILPSANLTMAFGEDVFKGTGNITIKKKSDDSIIETIPVSAVTISSGTVTIDPVNLILPPATEFYINIDAGALTDIAGNSYAISNNTDWSFTIIASSVVTSVAVPANNTYKIGDELDFTASFTLPITITGTPSIPVTIGASTKTANLKAAVSNSSTAIFSYTIAEGDLDTDGIALGTAISLNGGTIKDQFGTDAQLALNNVAATTSINVDGVRPVPTLTTSATTLVNGNFTVEFTFSEAVTGFTLADITVANGTASNLATITAGTKWSAEITPSTDGTVSASLAAGVANDNAGNASAAGAAVSKTYDGTAPTAISLTRKTANPILTASAGFRVTFSEDVTGVDLTDFEVILAGTATGTLNAITQVDAKTYDVTVTGISGQGSIGLNLKDDDSIIDAANNPLSGALTGEVYVTNMLPTDIALAPSAIDENNALSAEVGTLSTTDADATDTHTYSLIAGTGDTDNGSFMVAGNKLFAGAAFNHEVKESYSIRLQTEDNNGGRFEKAFTITINDVNEVPTDISLSNNVIDEADDAGVLVGTMASVDQDAAETFTYTLATGTGDDNNLLFTFTGDELRTATPINFETNTTLSIRVKVTDSGGLSYEEVFSITVNNVELEEIRDFTKDAPDARIKNFFSPNGDGINDLWVIDDILDNPINEVKVFSQNGTLIFSERNYKNTWDGTYKGEAIPPGTYYYEINVYNGEQIVKGFLTIIRTKN